MALSVPMRRCYKCSKNKPATPEFFHRNKSGTLGFHAHCKACRHVPRKALAERLWQKTDRSSGPDGCWPFLGAINSGGYGSIYDESLKRIVSAHRAAFQVAHEAIPEGAYVLHRCDNRRCVNPAHLFLGDHTANMRDMAAKGRANRFEGESSPGAKLTAETVRRIRREYVPYRVPFRVLGERYGVTELSVRNIVKRKTWRHI